MEYRYANTRLHSKPAHKPVAVLGALTHLNLCLAQLAPRPRRLLRSKQLQQLQLVAAEQHAVALQRRRLKQVHDLTDDKLVPRCG